MPAKLRPRLHDRRSPHVIEKGRYECDRGLVVRPKDFQGCGTGVLGRHATVSTFNRAKKNRDRFLPKTPLSVETCRKYAAANRLTERRYCSGTHLGLARRDKCGYQSWRWLRASWHLWAGSVHQRKTRPQIKSQSKVAIGRGRI